MIRCLLPVLLAGSITAAELPRDLFVAAAPADAVGVIAARAAPQPGATVTLTGVIGGRTKPFVEGRAIFTVLDRSLVCDSGCGSAWSGCSLPPEDVRRGMATVQVADANGKPVAAALEGAGGLVPGATVVVTGTVTPGSSDKGLIVTATAIHLASVTPTKAP